MHRLALPSRLFALTAFGAATFGLVWAQPAGIFTAAQAQSGRAIYDQNCSACHGANFEGSGDAPALVGGHVPAQVGAQDGERAIRRDPANDAAHESGIAGRSGGAERDRIYSAAQRRSGGPAGTRGKCLHVNPGGCQRAGAGRRMHRLKGAADGAAGRWWWALARVDGRGGAGGNAGVNVPGEVKNYVPVTTEMLQESARGGLADLRTQLSETQLQSAQSDHARQRQEPAVEVDLGDERLGGEPDHADRAQRHHLSGEPQQHCSGAGCARRAI